MRDVPKEIRVVTDIHCAKCGERNDYDDHWCGKCGQSLEKKIKVVLCPFCGEDWDETGSHLEYYCEGKVERILSTHDGTIYYDRDFWLQDSWYDYGLEHKVIKTISREVALEMAHKYLESMQTEVRAAEQAISFIDASILGGTK